ncbi:ATP-binding protein [Paenibacillus sp. QZ-Y1]|uniref:ATP-binding protein n=1 Tax=Paenibacillus sp. QZ-Y1 TaxID=3414511 RepID=UPI003F799048
MFPPKAQLRGIIWSPGNSISVEHLQRIWDQFYQVAEGRSRNVSGSGLGLAIVKQIVNDLGQSCGCCIRTMVLFFGLR